MKYRRLGNTDLKVSTLSFGCSAIGGVFSDVREDECIKTVHMALDMGINYLDTSPYYGATRSEINTGKALKGVSRDRYFIATKAGKYGDHISDYDYSYSRIISSCEESLQRLGVDYLDVLQLHDYEYHDGIHIKQVIEEGIPALNELKKQGKIRYTGITAYPTDAFEKVLEASSVDIILNHNHYSLNDNMLLDALPYLKSRNVGIINASPLSSGLLTSRGVPEWHSATEEDRAIVEHAIEFCQDNNTKLEKIAIQFSIHHEDISTTLLSSSKPNTIKQSINWANEDYDEDLAMEIIKILKPIFNKDWGWG